MDTGLISYTHTWADECGKDIAQQRFLSGWITSLGLIPCGSGCIIFHYHHLACHQRVPRNGHFLPYTDVSCFEERREGVTNSSYFVLIPLELRHSFWVPNLLYQYSNFSLTLENSEWLVVIGESNPHQTVWIQEAEKLKHGVKKPKSLRKTSLASAANLLPWTEMVMISYSRKILHNISHEFALISTAPINRKI